MIAGVNGAGKTTSIGKLAKHLQAQGLSVLLAAGDTFRAAAREQLTVWGERNNVAVIAQQSGDPAAVMFDAIAAARARGIDVVLADTAGRLPTQLHLMEEIRKVRRVIQKADPAAPHETLLVLDANTGQNALAQVQAFDAGAVAHRPRRHQARRHGQGRRPRRHRQAAPDPAPVHRRRRRPGRPEALRRGRVRRGAGRLNGSATRSRRHRAGSRKWALTLVTPLAGRGSGARFAREFPDPPAVEDTVENTQVCNPPVVPEHCSRELSAPFSTLMRVSAKIGHDGC